MSIQYYVPFKESTKIRIKKSLLSINTARGTKGLNMCLWGVYHLVTLTDLEHHLIIISSDTENNLSNWPPCSILDSSQSSLCIVTCMYVMHFIFINYNTHTHTHTHTDSLRKIVSKSSQGNWRLFYFFSSPYQFSCFELHNDFTFEVKGQPQGKEHFTGKLEI